MNVKDRTLLNLYVTSTSRDFNSHLLEFQEIIEALITICDRLHDAKVSTEYWKQHLEILSAKFALHSSSLAVLFKGTPIKNLTDEKIAKKYPDMGSIFTLSRAQMESYLMFYYLNVQPKSFEEGELRYLLYEVSGLAHRQQYPASTPEYITKKEKERNELDGILGKIRANKFFQSLPENKQKQLLADKPARIMGWEKLIISSHLHTEFALNLWKLQSNYAHSEMVSAIQIKNYVYNRKDLDDMLFFALERSVSLVCVAIKDLTKLFKAAEITYNGLPFPMITKINFWWRIATGNVKDNYPG
jgi:hypothetical protein